MSRGAPIVLAFVLCALLLGGCAAAVTAAPGTATPPRPQETVVSLTFDDGNADNFAAAALLAQSGIRATFYIPSGLVGTSGYMTWDQVQSLQAEGHEIGGHTLDHVNVGDMQGAALQREICDDRQNLVSHGLDPVSFAYPFGGYVEATKQVVKQCGYADARTIGAGPDQVPPVDPYALRAFPYVVIDTAASKLQRYVTGTSKDGGGWVILIFHHVCDGCDYFSVRPDVLSLFTEGLAGQETAGRLRVRTVGQIVAGTQ